jgi:predicted TIM-barrel fold metal-dependent hydrolase
MSEPAVEGGAEPLVDPHHHLWDPDAVPSPHRAREPRTYLLPDFLADAAGCGLVRSVHVQAEVERSASVAETRWLQDIADRGGFPHGIVAYANLAEAGVERVLEQHASCANVRGIRQILNWDRDPARSQCERPDYLTDPSWRAGYALLRRWDLSFDLQAYPWQMRDAAAVAAAHPDVPMIVNHTGMPRDRDAEGRRAWQGGMRALAERPNAFVKISGFGMFDPGWTDEGIRPFVLETIEMFGADRCMFASNFPVDRPFRPYAETFAAFRRLVADLTPTERRRLFHDNATRVYRLDAGETFPPIGRQSAL